MADQSPNDLNALTADIVAAHVSYNNVLAADLPAVIQAVYAALQNAASGHTVAEPEAPQPAVSIRTSVKPDYIVCLEDGAKLKMLKRYLASRFGMTPADYRQKWGLPANYPMVAPAYAEKRRELAKKIGLGRKAVSTRKPATAKKAPARRTRKAKTEA